MLVSTGFFSGRAHYPRRMADRPPALRHLPARMLSPGHVVRRGTYHGRDDAYYVDRFALVSGHGTPKLRGTKEALAQQVARLR